MTSRQTPAGEAFRDLIFRLGPGERISAVSLRTWFAEHEIPGSSRPGLFRHACACGWIAPTGEIDRYPIQHSRRGAWALAYRVTGRRDL